MIEKFTRACERIYEEQEDGACRKFTIIATAVRPDVFEIKGVKTKLSDNISCAA